MSELASPLLMPGPMRWSIAGFGVTMIIGWGSTYYLLTILGAPIGEALGLAPEVVATGFSMTLIACALFGPFAGRMMDRHGAARMMSYGSTVTALGLTVLSQASGMISFYCAWGILSLSAPFILYPAAFTALTQLSAPHARKAITILTFPGGLASTVFWPLSGVLLRHTDWRAVCLIYAALNLLICLPIHATIARAGDKLQNGAVATVTRMADLPVQKQRLAFILIALMLSLNAVVIAGFLNQIIPLLTQLGFSNDKAVIVGMLFGLSQVSARLMEMFFGQRLDPLITGVLSTCLLVSALVILLLGGNSMIAACVFPIFLGAGNGLLTIVRGVLVLTLFGSHGYGERMGTVSMAHYLLGAVAPVLLAIILQYWGANTAVVLCLIFATGSLVAMFMLFRHASPYSSRQITG